MTASPPEPGAFRPRRVATVVVIWVGLALLIDAASSGAGFFHSLVLAFMVFLAVLATPRAIGLWRGTVAHTEIDHALTHLTLDATRAFTPAGIIALDAATLAFALLLTTGIDAAVPHTIAMAAGVVMIVSILGALSAALLRRPRFLLPATMRGRAS